GGGRPRALPERPLRSTARPRHEPGPALAAPAFRNLTCRRRPGVPGQRLRCAPMTSGEGETQRPSSRPPSTSGLKSLGFVVYATVAWAPCLIGGVIVGAAVGTPPAEEGVIRGRTLSLTAALPEIL